MTTAPFGWLRVGAACPPVADPERNVQRILEFVGKGQDAGTQVLLFPEL